MIETMAIEHFDVLIIGAGLSGIGAGYHLQRECPGRSYAILESREAIGGTWDLFRYPGIRSDSDMYTLGYSFKPWTDPKAIADGPSILRYVRETAKENGIDRHIRYQHRAVRASWSSSDAKWTVEAERGPKKEIVRFTCSFLYMCSGYYNYQEGYTPEFAGTGRFKGQIVHPQKWNDSIDYAGKRVVVIGSGATAVTLVPAMTDKAAHVTMLQRSPTYILSRPAEDGIANLLRKILPAKVAYWLVRWKNVLLTMFFYQVSRRRPHWIKHMVRKGVESQLGPDYDINKHFKPRYNPWDQRLCLVPDADLFRAIKTGRASVVTDHIENFTEHGITLKSGNELEADLIVTATPATEPLLTTDMIEAGARIVAVGADSPGKQELDARILERAFVVVDSRSQCMDHGEAGWAVRAGLVDEADLVELGALLASPMSFRDDETVVADLTGVAVQDVAIARSVWSRL